MSAKTKTQIYSLLFSIIVTLICMAIMKPGQSTPAADPSGMTASQKLKAIENVAPKSSAMSGFIHQEETVQQANDEAANALDPKTR